MSHHATSWAITAGNGRGLSAAAKLVLWHLADRHNPDGGCFPSQARLAVDCEVSKSQLNVHLDALERAGLIRRVRQIDEKTRRQKPTRYVFAFEPGFEPLPEDDASSEGEQADLPLSSEPSPEIGLGAESGNQAEPSPISGQSRVRLIGLDIEAEPVREPVREPCVRSVSEDEIQRAFAEFWEIHPRPKDQDACWRLFVEAVHAGEEARAIVSAARRYAKEQAGNRAMYVCQSDNWLKSKRWRDAARQGDQTAIDAAEIAVFWAEKIKAGRFVPASAVSPALAMEMLDRGLVSRVDLARIGVRP